MEWLGTLFVYLHISSVIAGFGSTIAFPFFAARAAQEPMHGNFVLRTSEFISRRLVEPLAVVIFLTGVGAIVTRNWNPFELWLATAIVLFLVTFAYANLVQERLVRRMIELTSRPRVAADGAPEMSGAPTLSSGGAAAMTEAAPAGPPPEFAALAKRA